MPESSIPKIIIIVLNWNAFEDTYHCIKSLKKVKYKNFSIILVDNDSSDGSYENLRMNLRISMFYNLDEMADMLTELTSELKLL